MPILLELEPLVKLPGVSLARFNSRADAFLKQIQSTPGVVGSFIYANNGRRLRGYADETMDLERWGGVGMKLAQMLGALETCGFAARDLELTCEQSSVYVRNLGGAFGVVVCKPSVNWATVRMTINVAAIAFENDKDLQSKLTSAAPSAQETLTERDLSRKELALFWKILSSAPKR